MLKTFKFAVGAALVAATQLAVADMAEVTFSNVTMSVSQGQWWFWYPTGDTAAETTAVLDNPSFSQTVSGPPGVGISASVTDGSAVALAQFNSGTAGITGVTGSASVTASGGQSGWAFTNVFDRSVLVGGSNTQVTFSFQLDSFKAIGPQAQANAYIELCDNVGTPCSYTEAFVDGTGVYTGPSILSATYTSPSAGDGVWVNMKLHFDAAAYSVAAPVPEPSTYALWLGGLAAVGAIVRRRRRA